MAEGVKELTAAIGEAVDAARKVGLTVGYSQGVEASQARLTEMERDLGLAKEAIAHQDRTIAFQDRRIAELEADCLTLALRLYSESDDTCSIEVIRVMARWRIKCDLAMQEAAA